MKVLLLHLLLVLSFLNTYSFAQTNIQSASSPWTPVKIQPKVTTNGGYRPAFTGDFSTNRNGWKAGRHGDYSYRIGLGTYSLQKVVPTAKKPAVSTVALPSHMSLNDSPYFTIKVDVITESGEIPMGGLIIGAKDSLNYVAFSTMRNGTAQIVHYLNGQSAGDYSTGGAFAPGVPIAKNRNQLTIRRKQNKLHFYINEKEIRSSPFAFRPLPGNQIGVTTTGTSAGFQKLLVTLGPDAPAPR